MCNVYVKQPENRIHVIDKDVHVHDSVWISLTDRELPLILSDPLNTSNEQQPENYKRYVM